MSFVASTSVAIAATATIALPLFSDVSGSNDPTPLFSHARLQGNLAAGSLTATFDKGSSSVVVQGLSNAEFALPPAARSITVTAAAAGVGVLSFGQSQ